MQPLVKELATALKDLKHGPDSQTVASSNLVVSIAVRQKGILVLNDRRKVGLAF